MAQMVSRGGTHPAKAGFLTVADLLNRTTTVPVRPSDSGTGPAVSASSMLSGEARPSYAALQRGHRVDGRPAKPVKPGRALRRSAIAAGALLAVGSVFGAASLTDTPSSGTGDPGVDTGAGMGLLDLPSLAPASQPVTVIGPAAVTSALDPGIAPSTQWMPVGLLSAPPAPSRAAANTPGTTSPAAPRQPAGPTGSGNVPRLPGGGSPSTAPSGGGGVIPAPVGGVVPEPAGAPLHGLGSAVDHTGSALGGTANTAPEPVPATAGGLLGGITGGLVGGLTGGLLGG